jgi:tyrosine-specific transport protein
MRKQTGSIMLVAGTCIGTGMIALPMTLAKIGIVPSILFMLFTWILMYFTSLITIELNIQAGKGMALGALGRRFSGKIAEAVGTSSFKILSYALVSVYIYAGSSVIQTLLESSNPQEYSFNMIASLYALVACLLFLLPIKLIDYVNRFIFVGLMVVISILIIGLVATINWSNLPLFTEGYDEISAWQILIPVVFTSFGFQGSCHSFANYCNLNPKTLKRALLWGSFIPMVVYIIWNTSSLAVVYNDNPQFYSQVAKGEVEVGDLIKELSDIAKWQSMQLLVWWVTIFAIITSLLGVGIGLCDSIKAMLPIREEGLKRNVLASIITILPAYLVAMLVPNAFINVLGFAGMILAIIAIILPIYLFYKAKITKLNYEILKSRWLIIATFIIGVVIILSEISNIMMR